MFTSICVSCRRAFSTGNQRKNTKFEGRLLLKQQGLTVDEATRRLAYLREKAIRDEAAAMKKARCEGREEGREEENAKKTREEGISINVISKITGLTEEIQNI